MNVWDSLFLRSGPDPDPDPDQFLSGWSDFNRSVVGNTPAARLSAGGRNTRAACSLFHSQCSHCAAAAAASWVTADKSLSAALIKVRSSTAARPGAVGSVFRSSVNEAALH